MLTKFEIMEEYIKCVEDPKYVITTYFKTLDLTQGGYVPFRLFDKQREIIDDFEAHRFNLVTKPRQAGISTTTQAYMAVKCGFADPEKPEIILVVANKLDMAKKFAKGIKDFISQLPRWIWGPEFYGTKEKEKKSIFLKESQVSIELVNGSKIIAVATSEDALRGYAPTYLIFDEAAFIENGANLYAAAAPALSTGGRAILISTPNGQDPLYYETYAKAGKEGKEGNSYNIIEMKWYQDPRYNGLNDLIKNGIDESKPYTYLRWVKGDEVVRETEFTYESYRKMIEQGYKPTSQWYETMCATMNFDKRKIAQELDVSFLGSGGNVIDDEYINMQKDRNVSDDYIVDKTYFDGNSGLIYIWGTPQEGHQYILAADVATGSGADNSTFQIIDFTTMEQVVEYEGKVPPDILAKIIYDYGVKYSAYVVVDNIGVGATTGFKLLELEYPNLHYDDVTPKMFNGSLDKNKFDNEGKVPGFNINGVRLNLIAHLEFMVRTNAIKIRSNRVINEMRTFIYNKNGRPDHQEGKHDDLLMALGMGLWVLEHSFKKLEKVAKQTKAMLNAWVMDGGNNNNIVPSTFVSKENRFNQAQPRPNFSPTVSKNMQDPKGMYGWLFSGTR